MANARDFSDGLDKIIPYKRQRPGRLGEPIARPGIAGGIGVGEPDDEGDGIDSPLSETSRVHLSAPKTITSTDGLFVIEYAPVIQINMADASNRSVVFNYAEE